jgi:hypothetical protein
MHVQCHGHAGDDGFQKIAKLDCPVAPMNLADNGAGLGIERTEEVDGAVTLDILIEDTDFCELAPSAKAHNGTRSQPRQPDFLPGVELKARARHLQ